MWHYLDWVKRKNKQRGIAVAVEIVRLKVWLRQKRCKVRGLHCFALANIPLPSQIFCCRLWGFDWAGFYVRNGLYKRELEKSKKEAEELKKENLKLTKALDKTSLAYLELL